MSEKVIQVRIDLEGDTKQMFEKIKKKYNLKNNAEVIRLIIKLTHDNEFPT